MAMEQSKVFSLDDGTMCWYGKTNKPQRKNWSKTYRNIRTVAQLKATIRAGEYAWPGGYQMFLLTSGGEPMSFDGARKDFRNIAASVKRKANDGWRVVACDINYEDADMVCCVTGHPIPSAYGE